MKKENPAKELYKQLRELSCEQLWEGEVAHFDRADAPERAQRAAVVRAVGVVFSETGTEAQKEQARPWLHRLLADPDEKIRRYAMAALPKIGAGQGEEAKLLEVLRTTGVDREKKYAAQSLQKIAGSAALPELAAHQFDPQTAQKIRANIARGESPSAILLDPVLPPGLKLRIHLRGRRGLEEIVRDEVAGSRAKNKFRVIETGEGFVAVTPLAPFSLGDLYKLRCFGTVGFALGRVGDRAEPIVAWASLITSHLSRTILRTVTKGSIRYRLEFIGKGHQRGAVRQVAEAAYALCPEILNDARSAPWTVAIYPAEAGGWVELSPRLHPDPRLAYRQGDVPAASHPPLAACLARLAGNRPDEVVWDPFCGSGLELVERALLGGVRRLYGSDLSAEAIAIARANLAAAGLGAIPSTLARCDFRDLHRLEGLGPGRASLILTNPPMGKRVPIPHLQGLMEDLFSAAAAVLQPGGRLIFTNPIWMESPQRSLRLRGRRTVDMGGFDCRLEEYLKV